MKKSFNCRFWTAERRFHRVSRRRRRGHSQDMRPESCLDMGKSQADPGQKHGVEWDGMEWVVILVLVLPVLEYIINTIPLETLLNNHSIPLRDIACFGRLVTTIRG